MVMMVRMRSSAMRNRSRGCYWIRLSAKEYNVS